MVPFLDLVATLPHAPLETAPSLTTLLASDGPDLGRALGRLHAGLVHFPIALAVVAVAAEWWRALCRRGELSALTFPLLTLAAVSAVVSAGTGWMNASYEAANDEGLTLALHRWLGLGTAAALVVLAVWCRVLVAQTTVASGKNASAVGGFRIAALVCAFGVSITGHFGGELVHGEGYMTECLFASEEDTENEGADAGAATVALSAPEQHFVQHVLPILEANCFECHGARKQKGGLRLDSKAWLFNGEEAKWVVIPGLSLESELLHRVELSRVDSDAMPPEGPGLTEAELTAIRTWIDDGAAYPNTKSLAGRGGPGSTGSAANAALAAAGTLGLGGSIAVEIPPAVRVKAEAAAKGLIARGVLAQALALESPLWDVNASRAEPPLNDGDIRLLADIAPVTANLNLSKSAITDAGLSKIGAMIHLERLRLDGTSIGDAGVRALGTLPRLESINLVSTKVTPALADWVTSQGALKRIYVWQTALDDPEATKAMRARAGLEIVGADLPVAQPKGPPMPEDAKPEEAKTEEPKPTT